MILLKEFEILKNQEKLYHQSLKGDTTEYICTLFSSCCPYSSSFLFARVLNICISSHRSEVRVLREDLVYQLRGYALQELQFGTRRHEPKQFKLILEEAIMLVRKHL
jgi:hypothetical protein